jgi:hypothetical protein
MLAAFWQTTSQRMAERLAVASGAALAFWLGGIAAIAYSGHGLKDLDRWSKQPPAGMLVLGVLTVLASSALVQPAAGPLIRLLEGTRPGWALPIRRRFSPYLRRLAGLDDRWQALQAKADAGTITDDERQALNRIDARLHRAPADPAHRLPTRLGNILRAGEDAPRDKYGLDTVICWPRLWFVLPEAVQNALTSARATLTSAALLLLWGLLFLVWTPWAWWAAPVGLIVAAVAYTQLLSSAAAFSDLIESAFDLHRNALYEALGRPAPAPTTDETAHGQALTMFLWRGYDGGSVSTGGSSG